MTNLLLDKNIKMKQFEQQFKIHKLLDLLSYKFKPYEQVSDCEIKLELVAVLPCNVEKFFVPRYSFDIVLIEKEIKIGSILFRTELTEVLLQRGGHLGYEIMEEYRGNNYASKAINILIPFIRSHSISKILVTCDEKNIPSRKTIEKVNGKLLEIKPEVIDIYTGLKESCCYYIIEI